MTGKPKALTPLGLAGIAKQPAFQRIESVAGGEETRI